MPINTCSGQIMPHTKHHRFPELISLYAKLQRYNSCYTRQRWYSYLSDIFYQTSLTWKVGVYTGDDYSESYIWTHIALLAAHSTTVLSSCQTAPLMYGIYFYSVEWADTQPYWTQKAQAVRLIMGMQCTQKTLVALLFNNVTNRKESFVRTVCFNL